MRILLINDTFTKGGAEKQVSRLVEGLKLQGYDAMALSLQEGGYWADYLIERNIPYVQGDWIFKNYFEFPIKLLQLAYRIRKLHPDVVIILKYTNMLLAAPPAWLAQVPVIIEWRVTLEHSQQRRRKLYRLSGFVNRIATHLVANSQAATNLAINVDRIPQHKTSVIYQSVERGTIDLTKAALFRQSLKIKEDDILIGKLANFYREKNYELLVRAAAQITKQFPNVHFVLSGGDGAGHNTRPSIQSLVKQLSIEDRVTITDSLEDVVGFLSSIDIGVISSSVEGLSNTLLEYMMYSKPVVSTAVGGNAEVIEDGGNGYLVDSGDEEAMVSALRRLVEDSALRRQFGQRSKEIIEERFTREQELHNWSNLLQKLSAK